jgi:hypothetical protein
MAGAACEVDTPLQTFEIWADRLTAPTRRRRRSPTPMHRSQLCVVARRRTAAAEPGRGPREPDALSIYT